MRRIGTHKQVAVKTTAFVDNGIAELVTILNSIPQVSTFSSCEGRLGKYKEDAHVYLYYGVPNKRTWYGMGKFTSRLAGLLGLNGEGLRKGRGLL